MEGRLSAHLLLADHRRDSRHRRRRLMSDVSAALVELRGVKSTHKVPMRTPILSARISAPAQSSRTSRPWNPTWPRSPKPSP